MTPIGLWMSVSVHKWNSVLVPEAVLRDVTTRLESVTSDATAITQTEAERALNRQFYKSEHIDWVSMESALELAQAQQKPIHVISIDGPLADEVC